jgi:hypothetical protein
MVCIEQAWRMHWRVLPLLDVSPALLLLLPPLSSNLFCQAVKRRLPLSLSQTASICMN